MKLYLPLDHLPPLDPGQYYYHDLVGLTVIGNGQTLGKINKIYQPSSQYLASIMIEEKEILIPLEESLIGSVDFDKGVIEVDLPDGLLDIYLSGK